MSRVVSVLNLGQMRYKRALSMQKSIERCILDMLTDCNQTLDTLILVEHPPVYTIGIRTADYCEVQEAKLRALGADFERADRGGLITFHGPGQLVAYPVLNLAHFRKKSVKWYVNTLEQTLISTCHKFDVRANTCIHTGVWVGNHKIAAIGIHAKRFVTTHGVALNCNVNLDWYKHIVPCGIPDRGVTSMSQELGRSVTIEEVIPKFLASFEEMFECKLLYEHNIYANLKDVF